MFTGVDQSYSPRIPISNPGRPLSRSNCKPRNGYGSSGNSRSIGNARHSPRASGIQELREYQSPPQRQQHQQPKQNRQRRQQQQYQQHQQQQHGLPVAASDRRIMGSDLERHRAILSDLLHRALPVDDARKMFLLLRMEQAAKTLQSWFRRVLGKAKAKLLLTQQQIVASKTLRAYLEAMRCRLQFAQQKADDVSILSSNAFHEVRYLNDSMEYVGRYHLPQQRAYAMWPGCTDSHDAEQDIAATSMMSPRSDAPSREADSPSRSLRRKVRSSSQSGHSSRKRSPEDVRRFQRWIQDNHQRAQCLYLSGTFSKTAAPRSSSTNQNACNLFGKLESPPQQTSTEEAVPKKRASNVRSPPSIPNLCLESVKAKAEKDDEESSLFSAAGQIELLKQVAEKVPSSARSGQSDSINTGRSRRSPTSKGNGSARVWK